MSDCGSHSLSALVLEPTDSGDSEPGRAPPPQSPYMKRRKNPGPRQHRTLYRMPIEGQPLGVAIVFALGRAVLT